MNMHCTFKSAKCVKIGTADAFIKSNKLYEILLIAIKNPIYFNLRNFDDGQLIARLNALRALTELDIFRAHYCLKTANAQPAQSVCYDLPLNDAQLQIALKWPNGIKNNEFLTEMPALAKILLRANV
jgi:hypothetical protein